MTWLRAFWQRLVVLVLYWRRPPPAEALPPEFELEPVPKPPGPPPEPTPPMPKPPPRPAPEPPPPAATAPAPSKPDIVPMLAMDIVPPPDAPPLLPPIFVLPPHRREKWVTPKPSAGPPSPSRTVLHKPEPKPWEPPKPKRERIQLTEDPEQWGQYYFRDTILDQLDRYWIYLRRMKHGDADNYALLRQIGIQLVPWSATRGFDKWAHDSTETELSPWWREHRPAFGAIAYGFDEITEIAEHTYIADSAEPLDDEELSRKWRQKYGDRLDDAFKSRPNYFGIPTSMKYDKRKMDKPTAVWTPRFLYFTKWSKPPPNLEHLPGGDTYTMTVYWDRCDKNVPKRWRAKNRGGAPQDYGVFVEHKTGRVRVLKMKIHERVEIKWAKGPYGGKCSEPTVFTNTHWDVPDRYLSWSHRDLSHIEPEDYLRRLFVEAASMYELAVLGSMVRIAVSKGDLTATFGVEIKRMAHFFKDRDVKLTVKGARRPVFHIVRPHVRKDGAEVPMHFRGLREFEWAGYHVSVTVPGRDHYTLLDFDVGVVDQSHIRRGQRTLNTEQIGKRLTDDIKKGLGRHQS